MKTLIVLFLLFITIALHSQEYRVDSSFFYPDIHSNNNTARKANAKIILYPADSLRIDMINYNKKDTLRLYLIMKTGERDMTTNIHIINYLARTKKSQNSIEITMVYTKRELYSVAISDDRMLLILMIAEKNQKYDTILPRRQASLYSR